MIKLILIFMLIYLSATYSQQWTEQNKDPKYWEFPYQLIFIDKDTGFVRDINAIWKTIDGGKSFSKLSLFGNIRMINNILFVDNTLLVFYFDGNLMKMIKSTDMGNSFEVINDSVPAAYPVFFLNKNYGWIVTSPWPETISFIHKTSDGGRTWSSFSGPLLTGIYFRDSLNGIAIAQFKKYIYQTSDGGVTWDSIYAENIIGFTDIYSKDSIIYLLGENAYYSTDKGVTWGKTNFPFTYYYMCIYDKITLAAPWQGQKDFYISYDFMKTWERKYLPDFGDARLELVNESTIYATYQRGAIYKSTDLGSNWICLTAPSFRINDIVFLDENNGWMSGTNILRTSDGGKNWKPIYLPYDKVSPINFLNSKKGFGFYFKSVLDSGFEECYFARTNDGGYTWDSIIFPNSGPLAINFADSLNGFALGYYFFYSTTDGGETWDFTNPQDINGLQINFASPDLGYIAGYFGGYRTKINVKSNQKKSAKEIKWIPDSRLSGNNVFFLDSTNGWKGNHYQLEKTTDGGNSFLDILNQGINDSTENIQFFNQNEGIVKFKIFEKILKTSDGGKNWNPIFVGSEHNLNTFNSYFLKKNIGWAAGPSGYIYKYVDSIVPVELSSFSILSSANSITLNWSTASETNNKGFQLQKISGKKNWENLAFISGAGSSTNKNFYTYEDKNLIMGIYKYKLMQIDLDGTVKELKEIQAEIKGPLSYSLSQNYPNPFNPVTKIKYSLKEQSLTTLRIFDILGNEVLVPINEIRPAGEYEVELNVRNLPSGVYFYRLTSGNFTKTKKLILIK